MNKVKYNHIIPIICVFILFCGIFTYFFMSNKYIGFNNLLISFNKWNVYFDDITVSCVGNPIYTKPKIQGTILSNFNIALTSSNDTVIYQFKIVNDGNFDSKISDIVKNRPVCDRDRSICNKIKYNLTYLNGEEVKIGDLLAKNSYKYVKLKIEYPKEVKYINEIDISNLGIYLIYIKY